MGSLYEFWFDGVKDPQEPDSKGFSTNGSTVDFLEVICQIALCWNPEVAGMFLRRFLEVHSEELDHLRMVDFDFTIHADDKVIRLKKS